MMNQELIELLACPDCGSGDLTVTSGDGLCCPSCRNRYTVINGVPQMLPRDLAATLDMKEEYTGKLMEAMREGKRIDGPDSVEIDRFMWEHHLYDWGKQVIFTSNDAAKIYSSYAERGARDLCRSLADIAGGVSGKRLLYVGSGTDSMVTLPLQRDGAFIVNLDIVNESMQDITAMGASACVCGDIRRLPFEDESFDIVFSKGSLHHSQPIDEPLRSMVRVTKRGGHIVLVEPNKYMTIPRRRLPRGLAVPTPYEHHISSRDVAGILSDAGVADIRVDAFTHAPPGTPGLLSRIWERLGGAVSWPLKHIAFEFIVRGRKK